MGASRLLTDQIMSYVGSAAYTGPVQSTKPQPSSEASETSDNSIGPRLVDQSMTDSINAEAGAASPARLLQQELEMALTYNLEHDVQKIPLKWTVLGVSLFCLATWAGLIVLMVH